MKKKYFNLFIILVVTMFVGMSHASMRDYTGDANTSGTTSQSGCDGTDSCWISGEGIRITLVTENGNRFPGTRSVDYVNNSAYQSMNVKYNASLSSRKEILENGFSWTNGIKTNEYMDFVDFIGKENIDPKYWENFFLNKGEAWARDYLEKTFAKSYETILKVTNTRELANAYFIIEPLARITTRTGTYFGTGTEIVSQVREDNATWLRWNSFAAYNIPYSIYLNVEKVGFKPADSPSKASDPSVTYEEFFNANPNTMQGYAVGYFEMWRIIDIPVKECYTYNTECNYTACENTKNNRTCSSSTTRIPQCQGNADDDLIHQSGKRTITLIEGVCSLYCTESATVSYPGNVKPAITVGTHLQWPTGINGKYPLLTRTTLSCKVEMDDRSALTQECLNAAAAKNYNYQNASGGKITYSRPQESGGQLNTEAKDIELNRSCSSTINVNGDSVTITNGCQYTLPADKNNAIDKKTLQFINVLKENFETAVTNYLIIKNGGVLPVDGFSWQDIEVFAKETFNSKYDLQISNMPLGYNGQFTSALEKQPYICEYQITVGAGGGCTCPPGTKYSGADLTEIMEKNPQTCADAQEIFCDSNTPELHYCPPDSNYPGKSIENCLLTNDYDTCVQKECYIPNSNPYCTKPDGSKVDITACLETKDRDACEAEAGCILDDTCPSDSAMAGYKYQDDDNYKSCMYGGGSKDTCMDLVCNPECIGENCEYKCPKDSDYPGMDISNCVSRERGSGKTLVEALKICQNECNRDSGGKIIYRTISLENPFPSMNADQSVTQSGLKIGMFNDTIKGRYPGTNWNGITVVKNKILNNRGYDGSAIYQEAEPLYVIELDAKSIKAIRAYNKKQKKNDEGYADFTLECTNGAYCRSTFLRQKGIVGISGNGILTGGTCLSVDGKASFEKCYTTK